MPTSWEISCLLISVGGSPAPVAYSIEHHRPAKIVFFASRASRSEIETAVRPLATHRWTDQEIITTPDHEDLSRCMEALVDGLPAALANLGVSSAGMLVDYTGGTKTMSAALVLATIHLPVRYGYVGGKVRTKEGLGQVLDGSEALVITPNPWDVLALDVRRRLARQFNRGHFAEAAATADEAAGHVGERLRPFFLALKVLCDGYARWHGFDYPGAASALKHSAHKLGEWVRTAGQQAFEPFAAGIQSDRDRIDSLAAAFRDLNKGTQPDNAAMVELVKDLAAQAQRTCRLARRPDDGVARLYSALEKLAKAALAARGIDNSAATDEQIPQPLREEFAAQYADAATGTLRFGLHASYRLLDALGDPLGGRYAANANELRKVLDARNNSLLAHGWRPVDEAVFDKMLDLTLDFIGIGRGDLPVLPSFPED